MLVVVGFVSMLTAHATNAERLMVVVNPASGIDMLTRDEIVNIFMGRQQRLGERTVALPLDMAASNAEKASFYTFLLEKDLAEVNSYWARLIFSGQGSPPRQIDTAEQVREAVLANVGAIGYLPEGAPTDGLTVVHILGND